MNYMQNPVGVFELSDGLPKKNASIKKHPAQIIQELKLYAEEELKLKNCARLFGSGLAMQLANERKNNGQPNRLGLKSNYIGLEIAMNKLCDINIEDYMGQNQFEYPLLSVGEQLHKDF